MKRIFPISAPAERKRILPMKRIFPISAPAERNRVLPISALRHTLFTPSHEWGSDHFQIYRQRWIGPERMRMLHSQIVGGLQMLSTNMLPELSNSLNNSIVQLDCFKHFKTSKADILCKTNDGDDGIRRVATSAYRREIPCVNDDFRYPKGCFCNITRSLEEDMPIQKASPEECARTLVDYYKEPLSIEKGNHVVLQQLLFTQERGFLMKSNGQKVEMDGLSNKYVLLYIFPLVDCHKIPLITRELVELRNSLLEKGCFEIVSVGLGSDTDSSKQQKYFEEYASEMTWPFIPYEDSDARARVRSTFGFSQNFFAKDGYNYPYCAIVDPDGKILQSWSWGLLNYYGHDAFPFTDEKIISLYKEEASMFVEGVSLKALLGTSNRDYVLSPKGDKVPIQYLEDKFVCIILGDPAYDHHVCTIKETLKDVQLDAHPDFVPVYVYRDFTNMICSEEYIHIKDQAKKECMSVPWLRIPCGDSSARKIWRVILRRCIRDGTHCIVVGPYGSSVNFYALNRMQIWGSEAYPFTLRRGAELEAQQLRANFLLENVLQPTCQIIRNGGLKVVLHRECIAHYSGRKDDDALVLCNKRLLVLFGTHSCCELGQFLCDLKLLYNQKKGTIEEFEVIYISFDCARSDFDESTSRMPWFVFPYGRNYPREWFSEIVRNICGKFPGILAFERDGLLVGLEGRLHLKKDKRAHFPYVSSLTDEFVKLGQSYERYEYEDDGVVRDSAFWKLF